MALQKLLGKALARLQLRRRLRRPKGRPSAASEFIHHAQGARQFRPHHGQIRLEPRRQRRNRLQALQVGRQTLRLICDAAVSGRAVELRNALGDRRSRHPVVCSRPPPPRTRTFISQRNSGLGAEQECCQTATRMSCATLNLEMLRSQLGVILTGAVPQRGGKDFHADAVRDDPAGDLSHSRLNCGPTQPSRQKSALTVLNLRSIILPA